MNDEQRSPSPPSVALVVPAAGQGTRMGGLPKQFRLLGGAPVLVHTLRAFEGHPDIGTIIVAVAPAEVEEVRARVTEAGLRSEVQVVAGGASRQASVAAALAAVPETVDLVLVHDAVRPFVTAALVDAVIVAARTHGAAVPAVPVADTLRRAEGDVFGETVPRDGLFLVQTPQGFDRALLQQAHACATAEATDDAALVQALGHAVHLVPGDRANVKLTTPDDWAMAEALWAARARQATK
jgi:2-C-methyl-D-erythritol 4-phosphate cytidylyltransferase